MYQEPIEIDVDFEVPFVDRNVKLDTLSTATSISGTAEFLEKKGYTVDYGTTSRETVSAHVIAHTSRHNDVSVPTSSSMSPATAMIVRDILGEYHYDLLRHADQIRNLVVAKLIEAVDNPRDKMQALSMLGKIPEVGLFVDKVIIPPKSQSASAVQAALKEKLEKYIRNSNATSVSDVKVKEVSTADELEAFKNMETDD